MDKPAVIREMKPEEVMKGLESCWSVPPCKGCPYRHIKDDKEMPPASCLRVLMLDALGLLHKLLEKKKRETIVRCKDCRYCEYPDAEREWCKKGHLHGNARTWFCADGVDKEEAVK